jgi:hypothetical protein
MNKERLLLLADHMEKVRPENYDQNVVIEGDIDTFEDADEEYKSGYYEYRPLKLKEGFCGTTACVMGHAPFVPEFADLGMRIYASRSKTYADAQFDVGGIVLLRASAPRPLYDFDAAREFFDLTYEQSNVLFSSADEGETRAFYTGSFDGDFTEVTPQIVAQKLREFVATDGASVDKVIAANRDEDL